MHGFKEGQNARSGSRVRENVFLNLLGTSSFRFLPCLRHSCLCRCRGTSLLLGTLGIKGLRFIHHDGTQTFCKDALGTCGVPVSVLVGRGKKYLKTLLVLPRVT